MSWVEIGYRDLFWKIKLKWKNGKVWFNRKWNEFVKAGSLYHGDICVFQKTLESQKFEVCVFERSNVNNFKKSGYLDFIHNLFETVCSYIQFNQVFVLSRFG